MSPIGLTEEDNSTTLLLLEPSRTVTDLDIPTSGFDLLTTSAPQGGTVLSAITGDTSSETSPTSAQLETSFNEALTSSTHLPSLGSDQSSLPKNIKCCSTRGNIFKFCAARTDNIEFFTTGSINFKFCAARTDNIKFCATESINFKFCATGSINFKHCAARTDNIKFCATGTENQSSSSARTDNIKFCATGSINFKFCAQLTSSSELQEQITSSSVLQDQLTSSSELQEQITSSSVLQNQLTSSSVLQDQLTSSTVLQEQITSSSALQDQLTSSSVLQDQVTSSSVLQEQITSSSVLQEQITSSSVLQDQLTSSSVLQEQATSSSVLQEQVTSSSLLQEQVTSSSVLQEQETSSSLLQEQVTSSSVLQEQITSSSVLQDQLTSSSVLQEQATSSSVLQEQITSSSVLQEQVTSSSVLQEQETSSSLLQEQITSSSVLQDQLTLSSVLQEQATSNAVLQEQVTSSSVLQEQVTSSSVLQEQVTSSSLLQEQVTSSSVLQEQITSSSVLQEQVTSSSLLQEQVTSSSLLQDQLTSSSVLQEQISSSAALESQLTSSSVLQEQVTSSSVLQDQLSSVLQGQISSSAALEVQLTSSSVLQTTGQIPPSSYSAVQSSENSVSSGQILSTSVSPALSSAPVSSSLLFSAQSELSSASASSTASSTVAPASTFDGTEVLDSSASSFGDQTSLVSVLEASSNIQSSPLSTSSIATQDISESSDVPSETSAVPTESSFPSSDQSVLNTFRTRNIDSTESLITTNTISSMQSSEGTPSPVSVNTNSFSFVSTNVQSLSEITTPSQIPETSDQIFATSTDSPTLSISLSIAASYDASSLSTSIFAPVSEDVISSSSYAIPELSTLLPQSSSPSKTASISEHVTSFLSELQSKESSSFSDQSQTTLLFDASSALFGLTSEILYTSENSVELQTQTETPSIDTIASTNSLSSEQISGRQSETFPSLSISDSTLASSFPQEINLATESVTSTLEILSSRIGGSSFQTYGSSENMQSFLSTSGSQQQTGVISESLFSSESSDAAPTAGVLGSSSHQSDTIFTYTLSVTAPSTGSASSSDVALTDASIQESSFTESLIPSLSIVSTFMSNTESAQPTFRTPNPTAVFTVVSVESSSTQLASMSFTPHETHGILSSSLLETADSSLFQAQFSSVVGEAFSSSEVSVSQSSTDFAASSLYQFSRISNPDSGSVGSSATYVFGTMSGSTVQTDLVSSQASDSPPSTEIFSSSQSIVIVVPSISDVSSTVPQTQLSSSVQGPGSSEVEFTGITLLSDSLSTSSQESVLGTVQPSTSGSEGQSIASSPLLPIIMGSDTATGTESSRTYISDSLYASESVQTTLISSQLLPDTTDIPGSRFSDSSLLLPSGVDVSTGSPFATAVSTPSFTFPNPFISTAESASFEFSTVLKPSTAPIVILPTIKQSSAISSFDISLLKPSSSLFETQSLSGFSDIVSSNMGSMSYAASSLSASESELSSGPSIPIITLMESQTTFFSDSIPTELLSMTATGSQSFTVSTSVAFDFSSVSSSSEGNSTFIDTTKPSTFLFSQSPTPTGSSAFLVSSSDLSTNSSIGGIVLPTFSGSSASDIVPSGSDILLTSTGSLFASDVSSDSGGFVPVPTTLSLGSFSASSTVSLVTESSSGLPSEAPFETSTSLSSLSIFDTSTILPSQGPFGTSTNLPSLSSFDTSPMLPQPSPFETSTNLPSMSSFDTSNILPTRGPFETSTNLPSLSSFDTSSMLPQPSPLETSTNLPSLSSFDTSNILPTRGPFETSTNLPSLSSFDTSNILPQPSPFETSTNLPSMSSFDTSAILPTQGPFETSTNYLSSLFDTSTNLPSQGHFETSTNLPSLSSFDTSSMLPLPSPLETSTNLPSMSLFDTSTSLPTQGSFGTSTNLPSPSSFDSSTNLPTQIPFETRTNLPSQSSFLTSVILPFQSLSETSLFSPSPSFSPSSPMSSFAPVPPTGIVSSLSIISSQEYTDISSLFTRSDISTPSALMSQISATGSPQFVSSSSSVEPSGASSDIFGSLSSDFLESSTISSSVSSSVIIFLPSSKFSDVSSVIFQTTVSVLGSSLFATTTSFAEVSVDTSQISDFSVPVTVLPSLSSMVSESISITGVTSLESRSSVDSSLQPDSTTFVPTAILSSSISGSPVLSPSSSVIIPASDTNVIFSSSVSMVSSSQTDISSIVSVDTSTQTDVIPTVVPSSTEPISSSVMDLSSSLFPSPTSSSSATPSSSVLPPIPTTTPSLNTSDALKEFWVNTVIKVRQSEDVSSAAFKDKMEERLAGVYEEAFTREQMINNGTYQPLKRRKRYASSPDGSVKLQVVNVERESTSNNVKLTYLAEKDGKMVPSNKMVDALELLDHQEVALGLGYVVDSKAEPYVPIPVQPPAEDRKLWIIAAVLGPIALIIIIWIIICIACRCCNRKTNADAEEPHLMKVRRDGAQVQSEASGAPPDYPPEQGSKRSSSVGLIKTRNNKMSYEVNPDPDEESTLYPEVKKLVDIAKTNGKKKKHPSASPRSEANDSMTYVSEDDRYSTPARRKGKKQRNIPREADDSSSQIDNPVAPHPEELRTKPLPIPRHNKHLDSKPPASAQEEEALLERAEMERLRNKQRLREQRKRERSGNTDPRQSGDHEVRQGYKKAQKEIDAVLGSPDQDTNLPDVFVHKPKKRSSRRKKDPQEGHTNEAFTEDEQEGSSQSGESLDEAKRRMHKLLDDAFSLISSSRSSIGSVLSFNKKRNKVTPVSSPTKASYTSLSESRKKDDKSEVTPRANGSVPTESKESKQPAEEEKKHTPLYYNPTYTGQEEGSPRLETWSPYRAADEVALISLPQTQTVMDKTPTQERLQTTTFSESYPTSMRDSYYATEPAKPIVIRTKDLDPDPKGSTNSKPSHPKHQTVNGIGTGMGKSGLPNGDTSYPGMTGYEDIPLHSFGSKSQTQDSVKENGGLNGGPHKGPTKTWAGQDEVDVVSSLEPGTSPQPFIRSLREELEHLSTKIGEPGKTDSHGNSLA
ncbi:mucin-3A-like [Haliotis rubra]|uniref:mucin-3A-like n=1 Tax=Haliotis rubra TaxID=36100 RepID=UPI001EE55CD3|nr:mucin-3A-like [Haliotis rubra]